MKKTRRKSPRGMAISIIMDVNKGNHIQYAIDRYLTNYQLKPQDKNLITQLAYGYFRLKQRLLFILRTRIRGNFEKLPEKFLLCMCLALYEILYLDKIPDYASVSFYVEYIKKRVNRDLTSLANGVLRAICREKVKYLSREFFKRHTNTQDEFLSIYYSIPLHLVELLIQQYEEDSAWSFLEKSTLRPYVGIRINKKSNRYRELISQFEMDNEFLVRVEENIFGFLHTKKIDVKYLEKRGDITRMSVESQNILKELSFNSWNGPIWDMCAGVGGKLLYLLEEDIEDIWASDIHIKKLMSLKKELSRLRLKKIPMFVMDGTKTLPVKSLPNTLLMDVPCSGLGVINRRPDIKWRIDKVFLNNIVKLQEKMLDCAYDVVPKGGRIVYITCTWNRDENELQIRRFIDKWGGRLRIEKEKKVDFSSEFREFFYGAILSKN